MRRQLASNAASRWNSRKTALYGWGRDLSVVAMGIAAARSPQRLRLANLCADLENTVGEEAHSDFDAIASGYGFSLIGLRRKRAAGGGGLLVGLGINSAGQLGLGSKGDVGRGVVTSSGIYGSLVSISCGREHSAFIVADRLGINRMYMCGSNSLGQLGMSRTDVAMPVLAEVALPSPPKSVHCGFDHTLVLTTTGALYASGWGPDGQLGLGDDEGRAEFARVGGELLNKRVLSVSTYSDFSLAACDDGSMWTWGNCEYGQCALGDKYDRLLEPRLVDMSSFDSRVELFTAGTTASFFKTESGSVYTCGFSGLPTNDPASLAPRIVKQLPKDVTRIFAGLDYAMALSSNGLLYSLGLDGGSDCLGRDSGSDVARVDVPKGVKVLDVACGPRHVLAVCEEKDVAMP